MTNEPWGLDGPYFDDLRPGYAFAAAPAITLGPGLCALYQSICGDPLAISLADPVAATMAGIHGGVVNPALVLHVAIGQSTVATRRVIANLFYRGVMLHRPVPVNSTLTTTVEARAMRETSRKPGKPPRGMVVLGMRTITHEGDVVADFERCALLPFRNAEGETGLSDDVGPTTTPFSFDPYIPHTPTTWSLDSLPAHDSTWALDETRTDPLHDTVTDATALVRATQNLAAAHRDARLGQSGRRLVYGGHTVGLAQASLVRLLPSTATVVGWHSCDHTGPVFEDDVLSVSATLDAVQPIGQGRLLAFTVAVTAQGADRTDPTPVLDWKPVVYAR